MKLLIASNNPKKLKELAARLGPLEIELVTPATLGGIPEVEEDQDSFRGNAAKKARSGAEASGLWCLADDSGLEVDALGGAPGVFSARYAGEPSDDARNNAKLLEDLRGVPPEKRGARFVCALALAKPSEVGGSKIVAQIEDYAHGHMLTSPRGDGDFGYDPLFLFDEEGLAGAGSTFAELTVEEKSAVSHRGRALAVLETRLRELLVARAPR